MVHQRAEHHLLVAKAVLEVHQDIAPMVQVVEALHFQVHAVLFQVNKGFNNVY